MKLPKPAVIGHRGARGHAPENTIFGFERALELGADALELDVRATRDGVIVVMHDATVDRTTDGSGRVEELSWDEIRGLDAGHSFMSAAGELPYRRRGIGVPRLREVFERFPSIPILIEIKPGVAKVAVRVAELIAELDRSECTMAASFHTGAIRALRENSPQLATGASRQEVLRFIGLSRVRLSGLFNPACEALIVPERKGRIYVTNRPLRRAAAERGLRLFVWTVNQPAEIRRLLEQGVDGIVTDYPERVREAIETLGLR